MNLPAVQRPRLVLAAICLAFAGLLLASVAACGDDSGDNSGPAPTAGPSSGPGTISISSSPIAGQSGKVLLVSVAPQGGGAALARACIGIKSDRFTVPSTVLTDPPAVQDPCAPATPATKLPEGTYALTVGIYAPPAQKAEVEVKLTARVSGDAAVQIDGAALSR